MGRRSKLTPDQWAQIERRAADGESARSLAKEFGVDESTVRGKVSPHTPRVKEVAAKLVEAREALATLPVPQQYVAINLADRLRNISNSLASAAELGAATAHRLSALANTEVSKVDDASPLGSIEQLRGVSALTKLANDSASIALNLVAANKEAVQKINNQQPEEKPAPIRERMSLEDWKTAHGLG